MRKTLLALSPLLLISMLQIAACGGDDDDTPPPPPVDNNANDGTGTDTDNSTDTAAPPGQVMVTVTANSTPPGAMVTGGGRQLGTTPLTTQVPIPAPTAGQTQTFAFNFTLAGYQPAVINASPTGGQISITAALAPVTAPTPVGNDPNAPVGATPTGGGRELSVRGRGGGQITDHRTTTGTADVSESCIIENLRLRLVGDHQYYGDLHITLRGPNGRYTIRRGGRDNPFRSHNVRRARGDQAQGRWVVAIEDTMNQDRGVLRGWSMTIQCR